MSDEYDLSLCIHCSRPYEEHREATQDSAYLRFCTEGGAVYWSRSNERQSEREQRWKFVTEACARSFTGHSYNGSITEQVSKAWDALVEGERRWLVAWRYRA